jgi:hypothetical protein
VDHCEKVCGEFFATSSDMRIFLIKKDERCSCTFDDPFEHFDAESGQTVSVGHHNFFDHTFLDVFQKPRESFAPVVEPGASVFVDFVERERFTHCFDLALKVVFLFGRRDSTVDRSCRFRFAAIVVFGTAWGCDGGDCISGFWLPSMSDEGVDIEYSLSSRCKTDFDDRLVGPCSDGVGMDAKCGRSGSSREPCRA